MLALKYTFGALNHETINKQNNRFFISHPENLAITLVANISFTNSTLTSFTVLFQLTGQQMNDSIIVFFQHLTKLEQLTGLNI